MFEFAIIMKEVLSALIEETAREESDRGVKYEKNCYIYNPKL